MAKRKASKKPQPKKAKPKLETTFVCPFCNAEHSVSCTIDRKSKTGQAKCSNCGEFWETKINDLTEPIDIYSEWIDACEAENA